MYPVTLLIGLYTLINQAEFYKCHKVVDKTAEEVSSPQQSGVTW